MESRYYETSYQIKNFENISTEPVSNKHQVDIKGILFNQVTLLLLFSSIFIILGLV